MTDEDLLSQQKTDYAAKLETMTDDDFVVEVSIRVHGSALLIRRQNAADHWQCDLTYEEAKRRGKPWLYAKGWNNAYESQGHHLSDSDRRAAMAPSEKEHAN